LRRREVAGEGRRSRGTAGLHDALPADEFDAVIGELVALSPGYADLVQVLGRTGLRCGEARVMLVRDVAEFPVPLLHVVRDQPEGTTEAKAPKSGKGRRVPLPDALLPAIRRFTADKDADDWLFTRPGGGQLHRVMFIRATDWARVGRGRTLHDLRHTAACEWILKGVPLTTVQAWLGHGSIAITSRYLHHLGDFADRSALQHLNQVPPEPERAAPPAAATRARNASAGQV
jgi:integrase